MPASDLVRLSAPGRTVPRAGSGAGKGDGRLGVENQPVAEPQPFPAEPQPVTWALRLWALIKFLFCFEVGLFLLVFPWVRMWDVNWFAASLSPMHAIWISPFFRGAVSGLGVLNIWIGFGELFHMRPRSSQLTAPPSP